MKKRLDRNRIINIVGCACLVAAAALLVLIFLLRYEELWVWYKVYQQKLIEVETYIQSLEGWKFVFAMLIVFIVRTFIPFLSVSGVCVLTGFVLPSYWALLVNLLGILVMVSIKYFIGMKFGSGNAWKLISKNESVRKIMERSGAGNKWMLFTLRLVPGFPLGSVSKIYGSMKFPYWKFLLLSAAGFAPKLISYTFIGTNVYDPLSTAFLMPIVVLLLISGVSLLSINMIWHFVERDIHFERKKAAYHFSDAARNKK